MTISEQESMLFGGWAKVLTPWQIEPGATELSDVLSASIYLDNRIDYTGCWHYPVIGQRHAHMPDETSEAWRQHGMFCAAIVSFWNEKEYTRTLYPHAEAKEMSFSDVYTWEGVVDDTFTHMAILRYFEIWHKGTMKRMMFALSGTKRLSRKFGGMIGCNNVPDKHALVRGDAGEWILKDLYRFYPRIKRLPQIGIARAKMLAKSLHEQRMATRP